MSTRFFRSTVRARRARTAHPGGRKRGRRLTLSALVLIAAAFCLFGPAKQARALNDPCGGDVSPVTTPFQVSCTYPDGENAIFTVPEGVTTIHVVATGAPGEKGEDGSTYDTIDCIPHTSSGGAGGNGMTITGDLTVIPGGGTVSNNHTVVSDDQLQVYVDSGPYVGGTGGHGNHYEIPQCFGGLVQAPIVSGNGGDGGGAAVLTDTDIPSSQTRLDMVAPGGGGGGGGGSSTDYAFGFSQGFPGADGGDGNGGVDDHGGHNVLETSNGDVFGGAGGACVLPIINLASTVGCPGGSAAENISGGFMGAGGGGGGAGRNGGAGGQAGYENCTPFCTVIGEAGAGGGSGDNRVPGGWVASSNLTAPASLTISWANTLRPTTGISLIPDPDGANGWYVNPPTFVDVVASELGNPVSVFCDLDPATPPTKLADFDGSLAAGHGNGCDPTSLSAETADGVHTLYAIGEDGVGATSDVVSKTWSIDTQPPILSVHQLGATNADGSYWSDASLDVCANDGTNGSGIDSSKTPGITDEGGGNECVNQSLPYADGATAVFSPVTFYDVAGHQVTSGTQTVRFRQSTAHDILLGGDCGLGLVCAVPGLLTANEGGSVTLVGNVEGTPDDNGLLTIDWGDGSPPTTAAYPCAPSAPSCPFEAVTGPPQATGFSFSHTYANNPPGGTHYTITVSNTEPVSPTPKTASTTATVSNVPPTIALEGDCALCVNPTGSALTVTDGTPVKLAGQVTDPGTDSGTVSIDWGDASSQTVVPFDCATSGELCPTPSQQGGSCGLLNFDATCGYFSGVEHTYAHPGTFTITATATDQDGGTSSKSTTATVSPLLQSQAITVTTHAPSSAVFGTSFSVAATGGGSGNPVTFSSSGACSHSGADFTMTSGTGTCTVLYDQAGNGSYSAAPQVTETVNAQPAPQVITVTTHAPATAIAGQTFSVAATGGGSGNPVTYSSSGTCTNGGATFTVTGAGTCSVLYDQVGDGNYSAALEVVETVSTIVMLDQTITVTTHAPASAVYGTSFSVAATGGGSGNPVTFSSSGACSNGGSGPSFTMTSGTGTCTVTYDQSGSGSYNAAPEVTETVNAEKAPQAITVTTHAPTSATAGSTFSVAATGGGSSNPVTYSSAGACSNIGSSFTMTSGTGTCTVKYDQTGNSNYAAALEVTESVNAGKANQTITFGAISTRVYGDADFDPGATASSGLPAGYAASGNCSIVGGKVHVTGVGSCTVTASQAGNGNYNAATSVSQSFTISQANTSTSVSVSAKGSNPTSQFSDTVTVSATVAPASTATGNGVFSGTLSFQVNGKPSPVLTRVVSNTAPTQSVDIRLDNTVVPNGAGSYNVSVTFTPAAGGNYAGSNKTQGNAVVREGENADASLDGSTQLSSDGDQYVIVGGAGPNMVGTLSQSQAPEAADTEYVDFTKVNVYEVFSIDPAGSTTPAWTSGNVKVQNRSDWSSTGTGVAQIAGPKSLAAGTYIVDVTLVANGYIVAEDATSTLDVASASGTFIAGGGQTSPDSTSNSGNRRGRFAVNVLDVKNTPLGAVSYVYRMRMNVSTSTMSNIVSCTNLSSSCRDVDITIVGTKITALNAGTVSNGYPRSGFVTGQASVQFVDAANHHHYSQLEFTNATFRVDVTDTGVGGSTDTVGFTAYRNGSVFHQAHLGGVAQNGTGSATNQTTVVNGNIFVHPK